MLGRSGLDINDPDDKYTLKALPGKFSGLHLLAIMFNAPAYPIGVGHLHQSRVHLYPSSPRTR